MPAVGLEGSRGEKDSQGRVAVFQHGHPGDHVGLSIFNILPRGKMFGYIFPLVSLRVVRFGG